MKIENFFIAKNEIIEWNSLRFECDRIGVEVIRTDLIINGSNSISKCEKLVIGGSDYEINDDNFKVYDSLKLMVGQNVNMLNKKIDCMPIGLPSYSHDKILGDLDVIINKNKEYKDIRNLIYLGFRVSTNIFERSRLINMFQNSDKTSITNYDRTKEGYNIYLDNIFNHKFVLCPRGNGIDTHRIWESLYLRSIPIIRREKYNYFEDLPILYVNDWIEILNFNFLEKKYDEITSKEYDLNKLYLSYWIKKLDNM